MIMDRKYYVSVPTDDYGNVNLRGFDNLAAANKYLLKDLPKRNILKLIEPKIVEGGDKNEM